jgi:hypothetical protein
MKIEKNRKKQKKRKTEKHQRPKTPRKILQEKNANYARSIEGGLLRKARAMEYSFRWNNVFVGSAHLYIRVAELDAKMFHFVVATLHGCMSHIFFSLLFLLSTWGFLVLFSYFIFRIVSSFVSLMLLYLFFLLFVFLHSFIVLLYFCTLIFLFLLRVTILSLIFLLFHFSIF